MSQNYHLYTNKIMKEKINQLNQSIAEKRDRLKEKAGRYFDAIIIPSGTSSSQTRQDRDSKNESTPPISYILYGVAGLSAIGAMASDSKILCLGVAAASAFGGYKLSKSGSKITSTHTTKTTLNISSFKNDITSKVLDSVKKITNEWESFMELKQKEIQSAIASSSLSDSQKDELTSKTYLYEVIDISISDFSTLMNSSVSALDVKQSLDSYKLKLLTAIDDAANKQMNKYKSII